MESPELKEAWPLVSCCHAFRTKAQERDRTHVFPATKRNENTRSHTPASTPQESADDGGNRQDDKQRRRVMRKDETSVMAAACATGGVADAACSDTLSQTLTAGQRHGTNGFTRNVQQF